jgi:4-hydroxymandelate oxidase
MAASRYVQVDDYEPVARAKLASDVYDYYAGGAGDERTLEANLRAFDRWVLRPRVLRGSGFPDPSIEVLGARIAAPVLVAPWAYQGRAHPDGERGTVRGAARAGTIAVVSSTAVDDLEAIAAASDGPKWWQLYLFAEPALSVEMLGRVMAAGYEAICWTVDFPVAGLRHRDTRSGFVMPFGPSDADYAYEPNMTWEHLTFVREHAPGLPVLVKGILTAEDAALAIEHGVEGIVVSNHGGRQLDSSTASLDALPDVVDAVAGRVPVLMDGGVRRGTDVVKAIALGAAAVLVGRPVVWGLAAEGEDGVVGPVQVGQEDDDRPLGGPSLHVGDQRAGDLLPGPGRVDAFEGAGLPEQVQQAFGDAFDVVAGRLREGEADAGQARPAGLVDRRAHGRPEP